MILINIYPLVSRKWLQMVTKWLQNGYKMVTKWLQNGYKMVTEKCQKSCEYFSL